MSRSLPFDDNVPALKQFTILEATWTDIPTEVRKEVSRLWGDKELGNDNSYYSWSYEDDSEEYPIIYKYLKEHNVEDVLIHFWW